MNVAYTLTELIELVRAEVITAKEARTILGLPEVI